MTRVLAASAAPAFLPGDLAELLRQRGVAVVDFQAWQRIDEAEVREGEATCARPPSCPQRKAAFPETGLLALLPSAR